MMERAKKTPNHRFAIEIARLERQALLRRDGHFTLFRLTTGWKAMLGTMSSDEGWMVPSFPTIGAAVDWAIADDTKLIQTDTELLGDDS